LADSTRGFVGRGRAARDERLPPGQYDARDDWPVLHAEATPTIDPETWTFTIEGLVDRPTTWTWDELHAMEPLTGDGAPCQVHGSGGRSCRAALAGSSNGASRR
jgi:DMSO/TMAO reductase YedYZ molybdopterin-dependent catalytic subunit